MVKLLLYFSMEYFNLQNKVNVLLNFIIFIVLFILIQKFSQLAIE